LLFLRTRITSHVVNEACSGAIERRGGLRFKELIDKFPDFLYWFYLSA
jgi:hypothetical protein